MGTKRGMTGRASLQRGAVLGMVLSLIVVSPAVAAAGGQSRAFVVSFLAQQFTNNSGDCPGGVNPEDERGQIAVVLRTMGHSSAEVRRLMAGWDQGGEGSAKLIKSSSVAPSSMESRSTR